MVKKIQKFLPISDVVLEINKFAFMRLDNPNVQKWQYQQGPLYQKANLEETVSEMQEHHCLFCKNTIDHYHHVVSQSENGSNTIGNIVGLCTKHHDLVHKDATWQKRLAKKKTGLNKKYGALSVLNQIIPKKPCPFCGAFLENEAPSTIWCHPRNSCLLSLRGIVGADQIVQWDTRYGEMTGKDNAICEE